MLTKYLVTKKFVSGLLKGLTIREKTNVSFEKGKYYKGIYSSSYLVLEIKRFKMEEKCTECGSVKNLKRGWTNAWYCSEHCERSGVSRLHGNMPGAGPVPRRNWVPYDIAKEISRRWEG